ncbi:hypothetical protein [Plantibacter sp. CFBP 13570]|uniref:hypothetical protein n=1 Tax=Plantibacter sp. CFBP 13570 TaxID=2775272 RepID=UPI0019309A19|nr:hypothetical protein [Plantibacter sp. CFBP 13570]MBD8535421.1 hypothetical protein [Plantibacter sp. CFBP 13570]
MGFLDRLLGRPDSDGPVQGTGGASPASAPARTEDEIAVERYRYLLRTAPPETIEQVHQEAFTKLTPEQRGILYRQLSEDAPTGEAPADDSPKALARSATRAEVRQPGTLERTLGPQGGGMSFGSMLASSMLGTIAGVVVGSAIAQAFIPDTVGTDAAADAGGTDQSGAEAGAGDGAATDASAADTSADGSGWGDGGFGDFGGGGGGDFGF